MSFWSQAKSAHFGRDKMLAVLYQIKLELKWLILFIGFLQGMDAWRFASQVKVSLGQGDIKVKLANSMPRSNFRL